MRLILIALLSLVSSAYAQDATQPAVTTGDLVQPSPAEPQPPEVFNASATTPTQPRGDRKPVAVDESVQATLDAIELGPREVRELKTEIANAEQSLVTIDPPSLAKSRLYTASFATGSITPQLKIPHGFVVAVDFVDQNGVPWIIQQALIGDDTVASLPAASSDPSSSLMISPGRKFESTNLMVRLADAPRPIALQLQNISGANSEVNDRITVMIERAGAKKADQKTLDINQLSQVLLGVSPNTNATAVRYTQSPATQAWRDPKTNSLYLRTENRLISPAPLETITLDGVNATRSVYAPVIIIRNSAGEHVQYSEATK